MSGRILTQLLSLRSRSNACLGSSVPVHFAGAISWLAWASLAWRSRAPDESHVGGMLATLAVCWLALIWALPRVSLGNSRAIFIFGLGFRFVALFATPVLEDDYYRFLWDGYRFATTGDPYAEAPQARFADDSIPPAFRAILDRINHPDVPTVYGPLTEWAFRLSHSLAPAQLWPWKLILLGAELAIFALLWSELGERGRLLLAWCPLAIFETGFNAHPDALALALVCAAAWFARKSQPLAAGAAAGLAITAKIFALFIVPFLLWRQGWRAWVTAALTVLVLYAPFWIRGSSADLAGLRAMSGSWEFNSSVFAVIATLSSRDVAQPICTLTFGVFWVLLLRRWAKSSDPAVVSFRTLPPGDWIYGGFLLLSATANAWYCLWIWPFVALRPSVTGVCALAAVSLSYLSGLNLGSTELGNFGHPVWLRPLEFGLIGVAALWDWSQRKTRP